MRPCHSLKVRGGMIRAFATAAVVMAVVLVGTVPAWTQPTSPTVRLETVNGESPTRGTLVSADAEHIQFVTGDPIIPDDLRSIAFGEVKSGATALSGPVVHLAGGGRISVRDAMLVDDACQATLSDGRSVGEVHPRAALDLGGRGLLGRPGPGQHTEGHAHQREDSAKGGGNPQWVRKAVQDLVLSGVGADVAGHGCSP